MNNEKKPCCYGGMRTKDQCASCAAWGTQGAFMPWHPRHNVISVPSAPQGQPASDAGTIDTPELQWLLGELLSAQEADFKEGVSFNYDRARAKLIAHINKHVAAAVKAEGERYKAKLGQFADDAFKAEQRARAAEADLAKLRSKAPQEPSAGVGELAARLPNGATVTNVYDAYEEGRKAERAATAPVSAVPGALYAHSGLAMKFAADLVRMGSTTIKGTDYLPRDEVMARVIQWRQEWDSLAPARTALRASAGAPVSAAEDSDLRQTQAEMAGGEELPAPWHERCDWTSTEMATKLMVQAMKAEIADWRAWAKNQSGAA